MLPLIGLYSRIISLTLPIIYRGIVSFWWNMNCVSGELRSHHNQHNTPFTYLTNSPRNKNNLKPTSFLQNVINTSHNPSHSTYKTKRLTRFRCFLSFFVLSNIMGILFKCIHESFHCSKQRKRYVNSGVSSFNGVSVLPLFRLTVFNNNIWIVNSWIPNMR